MNRFNSQREANSLPPLAKVKMVILAMDLAVAMASVAKIDAQRAELHEGEALAGDLEAYYRACNAVVAEASGEIVGVLVDSLPGLARKLPQVPAGLGRVCFQCGCSQNDPCIEGSNGHGVACGWAPGCIPFIRDICTHCARKSADEAAKGETEAE